MRRFLPIILFFILAGTGARAQKVSVSTNIADWAYLGTANLEAGLSLGQHFSAFAGGRYNPWISHVDKRSLPMYNQMKNGYAGVRFWPWYVYSGWWIGCKGQYEQFKKGGVWRPILEEGTAIGAGLSGGYTIMIHKHLNLEFGIGGWGGRYTQYNKYQCADCEDLVTSGPRYFLKFDDLIFALVYVF